MDKPAITNMPLLRAATDGLSREQKAMEPKWFYDEVGSDLFEQITRLPEYYLTRTEVGILEDHMDRLTRHFPEGAELVELGSGASVKTRLLLDNVPGVSTYVPIDVSSDFLREAAGRIAADYPDLHVAPVVGDFTKALHLPDARGERVVFFPGSTLGNLDDATARSLLAQVRAWSDVRALVLGVDLVKDPAILERAYDDAAGVTAAFNLNLLHRMNREIAADFDTDQFEHRAVWNDTESRVEMHLVSKRRQSVLLGFRSVDFEEGETIHTENSRKFTPDSLNTIARSAGWTTSDVLTDEENLFAVAILVPA